MGERALAIALLLIAIVSVQCGASVAKKLFPVLGAEGISALRLGFATFMLGALWRPWSRGITWAQLRGVAPYGLALGAMNLTFYLALDRLPLGLAVALEFTGPLAVALLASRRPVDFVWILLAVSGIGMILPVVPSSAPIDPVGVALALCAGVAWGLYIVFGKRAGSFAHAGVVTTLGMFVATALVFPFGAVHSGLGLFSLTTLPLALVVALLSSAIPYSLEMIALKRLPAKNFGILMSLEPAVAALVGLAVLGEHLTPAQWLAIACIMLASFGSALTISAS